MKVFKNSRGFTLIELLLVIGIVAIILAVIVPLGLRARIDAKYGVVRQNASELASFASSWVEKSIQAQDEQVSTATVLAYYVSLAGGTTDANGTPSANIPGQWVAVQEANNWNLPQGDADQRNPVAITGRSMAGQADQPPEDVVEDVVPPDKVIRNPFNEVSIFRIPNDPVSQNRVVTGALALGSQPDGTTGFYYFAFAFQGTDNTATNLTDENTFHAGMGVDTIQRLRNGVFLGRFN
jgi:prepilin-type N-terminal cleavage/methylation domain-containing protein